MNEQRPTITVIGSCNMDLVVRSANIPRAGETIVGGEFFMTPGGKGANQAVAAAKLGAKVHFISRMGNDVFGHGCLDSLKKAGIEHPNIIWSEKDPTGTAMIMLGENGDNRIIVSAGANAGLRPEDIERAMPAILASRVIVVQLEIPILTVEYVIELAYRNHIPVIVNPAPAQKLREDLYHKIDVLTPNETEAELLTGHAIQERHHVEAAAGRLLALGVKSVVITLGAKGLYVKSPDCCGFMPCDKVEVVDTTAAGDAFTGALACQIAEGKTLWEAADFARHVAALSVTRPGAQSALPTRQEVDNYLRSLNKP